MGLVPGAAFHPSWTWPCCFCRRHSLSPVRKPHGGFSRRATRHECLFTSHTDSDLRFWSDCFFLTVVKCLMSTVFVWAEVNRSTRGESHSATPRVSRLGFGADGEDTVIFAPTWMTPVGKTGAMLKNSKVRCSQKYQNIHSIFAILLPEVLYSAKFTLLMFSNGNMCQWTAHDCDTRWEDMI